MKKILSIFLASAMICAPMTINAQAKECGIKNVIEKIAQVYTCRCEEQSACTEDIAFFAEKLKNISCILKGNCQSDSDGNDENTNVDIPNEEMPEIPENVIIPDIEWEDITDEGKDTEISENDMANEVLELVNNYRAQYGLSAVIYDNGAECAANIRAKETEELFSHTRPNGSRCFTALDECGVSYRGAGENIAMGQSSATQVMNDWMNSQGHRENILNPSFTKLGVGVHKGSDGRYYWAQMFIY